MATGKYPFLGANIFRLYETIGKGEYTIPEEVDPLLHTLLEGMPIIFSVYTYIYI